MVYDATVSSRSREGSLGVRMVSGHVRSNGGPLSCLKSAKIKSEESGNFYSCGPPL